MPNTEALKLKTKKRVDNTNCCVLGCHSKKCRETELSFHHFPQQNERSVYITNRFGDEEKVDRHTAWLIKLNMGKTSSKFLRVCSKHFQPNDYFFPNIPCRTPRLKKNAVPSKNLPIKSSQTKSRARPSRVRPKKMKQPTEDLKTPNSSVKFMSEQEAAEALLNLASRKKQETQVVSEDLPSSFVSTITTEAELNTMTGILSFKLFDRIVSSCESFLGGLTWMHKLSLKECLLMTFMKLKNGFTYAVLAVLFKCVTATCRKIFHDCLTLLSEVLRPAINWPEDFTKHKIVLDCIEIPIKKSKKSKLRLATYSKYKKAHTIKFMTAVTPARLITFVSKGYGGRLSNKAIFEQSGLREKLEMWKDEIMVDKRLLTRGLKVIQSPFLKKQAHFNKKQPLPNKKIERVNQRIKIFEILQKPLPVSLWPRVDDIFIIVCAIVNLTKPILDC